MFNSLTIGSLDVLVVRLMPAQGNIVGSIITSSHSARAGVDSSLSSARDSVALSLRSARAGCCLVTA